MAAVTQPTLAVPGSSVAYARYFQLIHYNYYLLPLLLLLFQLWSSHCVCNLFSHNFFFHHMQEYDLCTRCFYQAPHPHPFHPFLFKPSPISLDWDIPPDSPPPELASQITSTSTTTTTTTRRPTGQMSTAQAALRAAALIRELQVCQWGKKSAAARKAEREREGKREGEGRDEVR